MGNPLVRFWEGQESTSVWTRYCGTAAKAGGRRRRQTSSCSAGRLLPTRRQVWQATDTQLGRQVALKILPDAFAADPDRLARFKREAQILASLNHPNIAAIYDIEEAEGTRAFRVGPWTRSERGRGCVDGFEGEWQINQSDVTGGSDLYNINDKDMARQLAEDAGYAGEPIVVLASQDVPAMFNTVSVLVENMRDAGFNVDFRPMDDASVKQQRAAQSGWNMLVTTGGWANAANTRFRTAPVSAFVSRYAPSARLTELSELIHFETDQAKHLQWLNEIQTLYFQESGAGYHIGQLKALTVARSWLKGYEPYPILFLANAWLDR